MSGFTISLKAARVNRDMTQEQAASLLDISVATLVNYESGKTNPKYPMAKKMATIYNTPLDMLRFRMSKSSLKSNEGN